MTTSRAITKARAVAGMAAAGALLALGVVANLSCGPEYPPKAAARPKTAVTLAIGLEPLAALAIIAENEGFFSRQGLAATVRKYPSGKLAMDAMLSGEAQVATVSETPVVFESFKRQDFHLLASIGTSDNEIRIVARKDKGIHQRGDLKGKLIAAQEASSMHFFLHMFLVKHGLSEKDVTIAYAPPDALAGMLMDGRADACSTREPIISRAMAALGENAVVFEEPGLFVKYYTLAATRRFVEEKPLAARAVLRAMADAEMFAKAHPQLAATVVARTIKIARPTLEQLWPSIDLRLRLSQSLLLALEDEARWTLSGGLVKGAVMPNYLRLIHLDAMLAVKPSAVGIIR